MQSCSSRWPSTGDGQDRFYQVPSIATAADTGSVRRAEMRGIKAEGLGVISPNNRNPPYSEITPFIDSGFGRIRISRAQEDVGTDEDHGALAGIQWPIPASTGRIFTRETCPWRRPRCRSAPLPTTRCRPGGWAKRHRNLRRWFVNAAKRSKVAGFDLICLLWRRTALASSSTSSAGLPTSGPMNMAQPGKPLPVCARSHRRHARRGGRFHGADAACVAG